MPKKRNRPTLYNDDRLLVIRSPRRGGRDGHHFRGTLFRLTLDGMVGSSFVNVPCRWCPPRTE